VENRAVPNALAPAFSSAAVDPRVLCIRSVAPRLAHRSRGLIVAIAALSLGLHSAAGVAGEPPADRSLAELARASLSSAATEALRGAETVATFALSLVGVDYRWGGTTPAQGFDCSGLIRYVFQETTGVALPRTARGLASLGERVTRSELVPGDLVFFNTRHAPFSHVGIYLGNDRFIHAPRRGGEVGVAVLSSAYWKNRYDGARRLVGVLPALMPEVVSTAWAAGTDAPATVTANAGATPSPKSLAAADHPAPETPTAPDADPAPNASHYSDDQP